MKCILVCWKGKAAGKFVCPLQHPLSVSRPPFGKVPLSPACLSHSSGGVEGHKPGSEDWAGLHSAPAEILLKQD